MRGNLSKPARLQACLDEDDDRAAERAYKSTSRKQEAQALVPPGTLSLSDAPPPEDEDERTDVTYTVNEAIDHMGEKTANLLEGASAAAVAAD